MTEIVAKTERLILRTWKSDDREEFARHLNTPAVTRHLGGVQNAEQLDAAFARIDGYQRDQGHTFWAIERTIDSAFLGFCGLKVADVPGTPVRRRRTGHSGRWRSRDRLAPAIGRLGKGICPRSC